MSKVVLVTGASRGIGKTIACTLADQGWSVALHSSKKSKKELEEIVSQLRKAADQKHSAISADLPDEASLIIGQTIDNHGQINALINNAGILGNNSFETISMDEIRCLMDINFVSPMIIAKDCYNHMVKNNGGSIINISSITPTYGMGRNHTLHYASSKAALETMSRGLSRIGAEYNIRSNCIRPGIIITDQQKNRPDLDERLKLIPLGRSAQPEEIAEMVSYLLSDRASLVTGQVMTLSGGE